MPPKWDGEVYAKYRPSYPSHLYDTILEFAGEKDVLNGIAVDCGCASGQVATSLAERGFSKVIGIDTSESQLAAALSHEAIEYKVGSAESTGLPSNSVNLITAAAALHWFKIPEFFKEANRVLTPNGVLAAWLYNVSPIFPGDSKAAQQAYNRIRDMLWPFFDARLQKALHSGYSVHLETAQNEFKTVELKQLTMEWHASCDTVAGFVQSWSPYTAFAEKEGEAVALKAVENFKYELRNAVGVEKDSDMMVVTFPLELILAKDPL